MIYQELKLLSDKLWYSADMFCQGAHLSANKNGQLILILGLVFLRYALIMNFRCYGVERELKTVKVAEMGLTLNNDRGDITANLFYSDTYNAAGHFFEQMINKNSCRIKFSERYIVDLYNVGGFENADYYEQLLKSMKLQKEQERPRRKGLTEGEREVYDSLIKDQELTLTIEQKVNIAVKDFSENKKILIVDWYKDEQPKLKVQATNENVLVNDLPSSYDKELLISKSNLILSLFIDKAVHEMSIVG